MRKFKSIESKRISLRSLAERDELFFQVIGLGLGKGYKSTFGAIFKILWNLPFTIIIDEWRRPARRFLRVTCFDHKSASKVHVISTLAVLKFLRKNHVFTLYQVHCTSVFYAVIGRWTTPAASSLTQTCWWDGHGVFHEVTIFPARQKILLSILKMTGSKNWM